MVKPLHNLREKWHLPLGSYVMMSKNRTTMVWRRSARTRIRTTLPGLLWVAFSVVPCMYGLWVTWSSQERERVVSDDREANHGVMKEDEDDPAVWEDVRSFELQVS